MLASVPVAYLLDALTLGQLFVVALLAGALGQVLFSTAYPPFFVALVPRESYLDANSKLSASRSVSFVAGPAVGGALVQLFSAPVAVLVDAATFLFSAFQIGRVDVEERPRDTAESSLEARPRGLGLVVRHPVTRRPRVRDDDLLHLHGERPGDLFASRTLGLSAGVIGLAFGIGALEGVVGAVLAPRLAARFGVGQVIVAGAICPAPLALLALAGGDPTWAAATVLAVVEFVSARRDVLRRQPERSLQTTSVIPDEVRSRVAGAFSTINYGVRPLGAVAGGLPWDVCGRARDARARRDRDVVDPLAAALADSRLCARSRSSALRSERPEAAPRSGPRLACSRASARRA